MALVAVLEVNILCFVVNRIIKNLERESDELIEGEKKVRKEFCKEVYPCSLGRPELVAEQSSSRRWKERCHRIDALGNGKQQK